MSHVLPAAQVYVPDEVVTLPPAGTMTVILHEAIESVANTARVKRPNRTFLALGRRASCARYRSLGDDFIPVIAVSVLRAL